MRQISLREFRTRGAKALSAVPAGETVLLAGQKGPAYFLLPVFGDIIVEERELSLAMARASLLQSALLAEQEPPVSLDEINAEIRAYRKERQQRA